MLLYFVSLSGIWAFVSSFNGMHNKSMQSLIDLTNFDLRYFQISRIDFFGISIWGQSCRKVKTREWATGKSIREILWRVCLKVVVSGGCMAPHISHINPQPSLQQHSTHTYRFTPHITQCLCIVILFLSFKINILHSNSYTRSVHV